MAVVNPRPKHEKDNQLQSLKHPSEYRVQSGIPEEGIYS